MYCLGCLNNQIECTCEPDDDDFFKCKKCKMEIDCECMNCHYCNPETKCSECGLCHSDGWEAGACWNFHNNPDYDPFDI